jgi:hypothetical protein
MTTSLSAHAQSLMQAFNLHEDDLIANREGRISERQMTWLAPPKFGGIVLAVVLGHFVLIGGVLGAIALITGEPFMFVVVAIVAGLGALPFMMVGRDGVGRPVLQNDVRRGKVIALTVPVLLDPESGNGRYHIQAGELRFKVSSRVYNRFIPEADYTLYYLPDSKQLLSAEPA